MVFARLSSPRPLTLSRSISMTTYSSTKAAPYVYICTHKETNEFYIGYRMVNVKLNIPSHLDLPEYKTSSTTVNPDFHDYTWTIIAEFFDPSHAYTFEQQLIFDNWKNPLLLNGRYHLGEDKQFRNSGPHSDESKQKISDATKGIKRGPNGKKGIPNGRKGIPSGQIPWNKGMKGIPTGRPAWNKGIPNRRKGIPLSDEHKQNLRKPKGKQKNPAAEVECPHCGLVGRGGNMTRKHFDNCKMNIINQ